MSVNNPTLPALDLNSLKEKSWVQGVDVHPLFEKFSTQIWPFLKLRKTSALILEAFANVDVTAERLSDFFAQNPYYENTLLRHVDSLSNREDEPSVENAIVLLGMENTRNFVVALQMLRTIQNYHPVWDQSGRIQFSPKEYVKHALRVKEKLDTEKDEYTDMGYLAGLLFDYLLSISQHLKLRIDDPMSKIFQHGLKTAEYGRALSREIKDFGFGRHVYGACLVHDIGKVVLAMLEPEYPKFMEKMESKKVPRTIRHFLERERFGITHDFLGGLCCMEWGLFGMAAPAISNHHNPLALKDQGLKREYLLAGVISLASNLARGVKDPALALGEELSDFPLSPKRIQAAVERE